MKDSVCLLSYFQLLQSRYTCPWNTYLAYEIPKDIVSFYYMDFIFLSKSAYFYISIKHGTETVPTKYTNIIQLISKDL